MVIKLDMEKAFDRLEWSFLFAVLKAFGFADQFIKLIQGCLLSQHFSVLVNGSPAGYFRGTRGIRQGDPLSPALFILASEALSRGLMDLTSKGTLTPYHTKLGSPIHSHLLFADDTILFTNGSIKNLKVLFNFLHCYECSSGQRINRLKSSFYLSDKESRKSKAIQQAINIRPSKFPMTYLGAPIYFGKWKIIFFSDLIAKVRHKLQHWTNRTLAQSSKLVLAKHVLLSIPQHLLASCTIPSTVIEKLHKIFNQFFWQTSNSHYHWHNWKFLATPCQFGGLGIRNLHHVAVAYKLKLCWKLYYETSSPWTQFCWHKYTINNKLACPITASLNWKKLYKLIPFFKSHIKWVIGKGNISFWHDTWHLNSELSSCALHPPDSSLISDLLTENGEWNMPYLSHMLPLDVVQSILASSYFIVGNAFDKLVWKPTKDGKFTVKSAVSLLQIESAPMKWPSFIWKSKLPLKLALFSWKMFLRSLPTDDTISSLGFSIASKCTCCTSPGTETIEHLFLQSEVAMKVWQYFAACCYIDNLHLANHSLIQTFSTWAYKIDHSKIKVFLKWVPHVICWSIWRGRNVCKHSSKTHFTAAAIIYSAIALLRDIAAGSFVPDINLTPSDHALLAELQIQPTMRRKALVVHAQPLPYSGIKVHLACLHSDINSFGSAFLVQGAAIHSLLAYSFFTPSSEKFLGITMTIIKVLQLCTQFSSLPLHFYMDDELVVNYIKQQKDPPWNSWYPFHYMCKLLQTFKAEFHLLPSEFNQAARRMAQISIEGRQDYSYSDETLPSMVKELILQDASSSPAIHFPP